MITKADIQLVRALVDKREREEYGLFVAEGRKAVEEVLASEFTVRRIFGTERYAGISGIELTGEREIGRMSNLRTPQGILAVVEIPQRPMPPDLFGQLVLALDGVQDPGNLGTVVRTADWFGIRDIICSPESADCFSPKAVQATMGSLFRMRVHYAELPDFLSEQAGLGIPLYGAFLDGEDIFGADLGSPAQGIAVFGGEGSGISSVVGAALDSCGARRLFIPPFPADAVRRPESLNVGAAAAILCAEMRRR